MVRFR